MAKDSTKNLIPVTERSKEEARALSIKGGKKSGEVRRKKRDMKNALNLLLQLDVKSNKVKEQLKTLGIDEKDMNNEMALMVSVLNKGLHGDMQAVNFIRDTSGQMPTNKFEIDKAPTIVDDI